MNHIIYRILTAVPKSPETGQLGAALATSPPALSGPVSPFCTYLKRTNQSKKVSNKYG